MLKAVLFDLGDTLFDFDGLDNRAVWQESARRTYDLLAARGLPVPSYGRYYRRKLLAVALGYAWSRVRGRDFSLFDLMCRSCSKMGLALDEPEARELMWEWYLPVTRRTTVASCVVPTLERLRDRGLRLAIVSNTYIPGFVLDRHLAEHGLLDLFPVRVYSSEFGYRKPHPRIFRRALDLVGVEAEEALFVGDKLRNDIRGARGVGMRTVLRDPRAARAGAHPVADFVVRKVSELPRILPHLGAALPPLATPDLLAGELAYEA